MPPSSHEPAAEVLPTDTPAHFEAAAERAAALLRAGHLVALPTETVYGLAANALDPAAVAQVFRVKGRPADNPLIVHVSDLTMARRCAREWPTAAERLAKAFWPGPLTLVLPRSPEIPDVVTAGGETVGIRWPSHPLIQAVIRKCGFPLAAPSANRSNRLSPTTATHVRKDLGHRIPLIVDGGPAHVGIESTVVDLTEAAARILRPGMIHEAALAAVVGTLATGPGPAAQRLRSPGLLPRHYCPRARLEIWSWENDADLAARVKESGVEAARLHILAHTHVPAGGPFQRVAVIPRDPEAFARALYAELHACDDAGAERIVVEAVPHAPEWSGLADRLRRAASSHPAGH